jgi:2',3'-cyclic-nucleotide 2'-phosphodiesterase (5'-nucleotidase family)
MWPRPFFPKAALPLPEPEMKLPRRPSRSHRSAATRSLLLVALAASALNHVSCLPTLDGLDVDLSGQQVRLTFLHTSDIHSRLLPYDFNPLKTDVDLGLIPEAGPFGGATRMAALIQRERLKSDRVLHLDSGDSFQGAPVFNLNLGEAEYRFLSLVGLDAAVVGNHEFDAGAASFTKQARDAAKFPVLVANYQWEDYSQAGSNATALYTSPYTIKNLGGLRVGIIGLGNFGSLNSIVEQGNSLQAIPLEINEITRSYVEFLRPAVDLIAITSHAGLTEDQDLIQGYEAYYEWSLARPYVERADLPWQVLERFGCTTEQAAANECPGTSVVRVLIPGVSGIDAILGGHLHIVLNPPQILTDPKGRKVILSHGGAFSKYLNRIDAVVKMPEPGVVDIERGEIQSFDFKVFPIDSLWCSEGLHDLYKTQFWSPGEFMRDGRVQAGLAQCKEFEDRNTTHLLMPYMTELDVKLNLTSLFAFAPRDIARRNNSTGGDSPLGNIAADSMRRRRGVEAEVALTNSLGIRDNLYAGPLTQEAMFNVFPFENTINIMFLSGREMQELFDFVAERSSQRGCTSQAQVSGVRFTMDCAQAQLNAVRIPCNVENEGNDCPADDRSGGRFPWQCIADTSSPTGGRCWSHPGTNITIGGLPLNENETYRVAVNDYIARGGSGFLVLKRNTTRVETGIPLRDSLIGYMQNFCSCDEVMAGTTDADGNLVGKVGQPCGYRDPENPTRWIVDDQEKSFCASAAEFRDDLATPVGTGTCADVLRRDALACGALTAAQLSEKVECGEFKECKDALPAGPPLGRCSCREALSGDPVCGNVTRAVRNFCENPTALPIAVGIEDGRISRRVK